MAPSKLLAMHRSKGGRRRLTTKASLTASRFSTSAVKTGVGNVGLVDDRAGRAILVEEAGEGADEDEEEEQGLPNPKYYKADHETEGRGDGQRELEGDCKGGVSSTISLTLYASSSRQLAARVSRNVFRA